jgi:hypothetical protein
MSCIELALAVIDHDEQKQQGFRCGLISSHNRAYSLIEYLACKNDAHRIGAAIEAFDGPLWRPEVNLRKKRNCSDVTIAV